MKRLILPALACLVLPAAADAQGEIGTLTLGTYACELPGDASGPVGRRVASEDFTIRNASSYQAADGGGSYLLTGNRVIMTSGPFRRKQYRRVSDRVVHALGPNGRDTPLRCVRTSAHR